MTLQFRGKYHLSHADENAVTCVAFSVNGDYLASGGLGQKLQIFSLADGQLHYSITTPSPIKSLIWLPAVKQVLVCACHSGILMNVIIRPGVSICFDLSQDPHAFHTKGYHGT
jgi:WD40 repeat protein